MRWHYSWVIATESALGRQTGNSQTVGSSGSKRSISEDSGKGSKSDLHSTSSSLLPKEPSNDVRVKCVHFTSSYVATVCKVRRHRPTRIVIFDFMARIRIPKTKSLRLAEIRKDFQTRRMNSVKSVHRDNVLASLSSFGPTHSLHSSLEWPAACEQNKARKEE